MSTMVRLFSLDRATVTIGSIIVREFADGGGAVKLELDGEDGGFTQAWGAVLAVKKLNKIGKLTLKIAQGAAENDALSRKRAEVDATGLIRLPFSVQDQNGTTMATGTCLFGKVAAIEWGTEGSSGEWTFPVAIDPPALVVGQNF